ncbi:MAG: creatininase, partial [Pseudomonadota bacterium]
YFGVYSAVVLREDADSSLQPNMVITFDPMLSVPQTAQGAGGYRDRDLVVITEQGHQKITALGCGPDHNIITT